MSETADSNLVAHARRELELIGEDSDVIEWFIRVVREVVSYGHSGGSASICIPRLNQLLRYEPLGPLTDAPGEWEDRSEMSGRPWWQSIRDPRAMSHDGGRTYWLVTDSDISDEVRPVYVTTDTPAEGTA